MADLSFGSSPKIANGAAKTKVCKAGEAIAAGDNCYQTGQYFYKVVTNDTDTKATGAVMALTAASALDDFFVGAMPGTEIEVTSAFTQAVPYFASDNAGKSAPQADPSTGRKAAIVGWGKDANIFVYQPQLMNTTHP